MDNLVMCVVNDPDEAEVIANRLRADGCRTRDISVRVDTREQVKRAKQIMKEARASETCVAGDEGVPSSMQPHI